MHMHDIESEVMSILEEVGIDAYKKGSVLPSDKLTHFGSRKEYDPSMHHFLDDIYGSSN